MHPQDNRPGSPRQVEAVRQNGVQIDRQFKADFSFCDGVFQVKWEPDVPYGKKLRKLYPAYLRARDTFLTRVAAKTGGTVVMVNSDGSLSVIEEPEAS